MALLQSTDIPHPALEALFTIDEETGMTGAMGLKGGLLTGWSLPAGRRLRFVYFTDSGNFFIGANQSIFLRLPFNGFGIVLEIIDLFLDPEILFGHLLDLLVQLLMFQFLAAQRRVGPEIDRRRDHNYERDRRRYR